MLNHYCDCGKLLFTKMADGVAVNYCHDCGVIEEAPIPKEGNRDGKLFYHKVPDEWSKEEKLRYLEGVSIWEDG